MDKWLKYLYRHHTKLRSKLRKFVHYSFTKQPKNMQQNFMSKYPITFIFVNLGFTPRPVFLQIFKFPVLLEVP